MSDTIIADGEKKSRNGSLPAEGGSGADPGAGQTATPFFHTFRDREEAEKGWKEAQAALTRAQQEAAEAKREAEITRIAKEAAEAKAMATAHLQEDEQSQLQQERETWIARLREKGEEGVLELVQGAFQNTEAKLAEIRKAHQLELQRMREDMSAIRESADPFYQAHQNEIEGLVKDYGIARPAAIKLFKDKLNKSTVPIGPHGPGAMPNTVTRPDVTTPAKRVWTAEERARMKTLSVTDKEIDE